MRAVASQAMRRAMGLGGNDASAHAGGRAARRLLAEAVAAVRALVAGPAAQVVFAASPGEALLQGLGAVAGPGRGAAWVHEARPFDPAAALLAGRRPVARGARAPAGIARRIGWLGPLAGGPQHLLRLPNLPGRRGQAASWLRAAWAAGSTLVIPAAALGGPAGIAALVAPAAARLAPAWWGGGQQGGLRPGTSPLVLIAGLAAVVRP